MADILIVDDEKQINDLIMMKLRTAGHHTCQAFTGSEALKLIRREHFDLAFLDIALPQTDGRRILPHFLKKNIPVIYLTAKDSLPEYTSGLRSGADDYLAMPMEASELLRRTDAALRRSGNDQKSFVTGDLRIDFQNRTVWKSGQEKKLTSQEFLLLEVLARNCNTALSRNQLLKLAWGYDYGGETRTVDIHIQRLRRKLGLEHSIQTVYKYGYRLEKQ